MEVTELKDDYFYTIGYDEITKQLHVKFISGRYVIFYEVRKLDYMGMMSSNHFKEYFDGEIEPRYPYDVVNE